MSTETDSYSAEPSPRKAYLPPLLARVDLQADEVLAIGCKMVTFSSGLGSTANCIVNTCAGAGS